MGVASNYKKMRAIYAHCRQRKLQALRAALSAGAVGRNDPCPCGSGKKYKKCCMAIPTSGQTDRVRTSTIISVTPCAQDPVSWTSWTRSRHRTRTASGASTGDEPRQFAS